MDKMNAYFDGISFSEMNDQMLGDDSSVSSMSTYELDNHEPGDETESSVSDNYESDCESPDCYRRDFQIPFLRDVYSYLLEAAEAESTDENNLKNPADATKSITIDVTSDDEGDDESTDAEKTTDDTLETVAKPPLPIEVETIIRLKSSKTANLKIRGNKTSGGPGNLKPRSAQQQNQNTSTTRYQAVNISVVTNALATMQCLISSFTCTYGSERITYRVHENPITKKKFLLYKIEETLHHATETDPIHLGSDLSARSGNLGSLNVDESPDIINYRGTTLPVFRCVICHAVDANIDEIITISTRIDPGGHKIASCTIERAIGSVREGHEQSAKFSSVITKQTSKVMKCEPIFKEMANLKLFRGYQIPFFSNVLVYLFRSIKNDQTAYNEVRSPFTGEFVSVYSIEKATPNSDAAKFLAVIKSKDFFGRLNRMKQFRATHRNLYDCVDDEEEDALAPSCSFKSCFRSVFC